MWNGNVNHKNENEMEKHFNTSFIAIIRTQKISLSPQSCI